MKIVFFEVEDMETQYMKSRISGHDVEFYKTPIDKTASASIYDADIICTFILSNLDKATLSKFANLKLVSTMSTGYDHINIQECKRRGIIVTNVPAYGENTVAEHTFGLILNLTRNIHKAYRRSRYEEFTYKGLIGMDLYGKTLGVIGAGKIGMNVIRIARGFNMRILAYEPRPKEGLDEAMGFKYASMDEVLMQSDIITLHVPLNEKTHHMINGGSIEKMKNGVIIINTARGGVIDTTALIRGLDSGKIGAAGLDVLEGETLIREEKELIRETESMAKEHMKTLLETHELMTNPKVLITPHLGFYSKEAVQRIMDETLKNIYDLIERRPLTNQVNE